MDCFLVIWGFPKLSRFAPTSSGQASRPTYINKKKSSLRLDFLKVIPLGLEPRTHTLKVYCSTS